MRRTSGYPGVGRGVVGDVLDQDVIRGEFEDIGVIEVKMNDAHRSLTLGARHIQVFCASFYASSGGICASSALRKT